MPRLIMTFTVTLGNQRNDSYLRSVELSEHGLEALVQWNRNVESFLNELRLAVLSSNEKILK